MITHTCILHTFFCFESLNYWHSAGFYVLEAKHRFKYKTSVFSVKLTTDCLNNCNMIHYSTLNCVFNLMLIVMILLLFSESSSLGKAAPTCVQSSAISLSDASILRMHYITHIICASICQRLASHSVARWNHGNSEPSFPN